LAFDSPMTYEQILAHVDDSQLVMVTGEQDNAFTPGGGGMPQTWNGLHDSGSLMHNEARNYSTPVLAAGSYQFAITGSGDADLYVRIGAAPTLSQFDCRPYKTGANESCTVQLAEPASIFVMVNGYSATSSFDLAGKKN